MLIAIDIREFAETGDPPWRYFLEGLFITIGRQQAFHQFLVIDRNRFPVIKREPAENFTIINAVTGNSGLRARYWQHIKIPALLKKRKAAICISGLKGPDLPAGIPVCLIIPFIRPELSANRHLKQRLAKAKHIIIFSETVRDQLINKFGIDAGKISLLAARPARCFSPCTFEEKQAVKNRYSEGREYFIYTGDVHSDQLVPLLKAFSLFKKRQQSGIRLLLTEEPQPGSTGFLENYKYREDILIPGHTDSRSRARLIAAAYALVDPAPEPGSGMMALEAACSGIPAIAAAPQPFLPEGAYLAADMREPADLAANLMRIYKDESLRKEIIEKAGTAGLSVFSETTARDLWSRLESAMK